jgi:hypothetical protein
MGAVERFCNRAMLLERGGVVDIADPASIARQYNKLNFDRARAEAADSAAAPERLRTPPVAELLNAWFESEDGKVIVTANQGEPCSARMDVHFLAEIENPIFAITLADESGHGVFATSTNAQRITTGRFSAGATASIRLRFENWLAPGRYVLVATVARDGFGADILDAHMTNSIIVLADRPGGGVIDLPHTLEIGDTPSPR